MWPIRGARAELAFPFSERTPAGTAPPPGWVWENDPAARMGEALLRRANIAAEKKLTVGELVLDEDEMSASVGGKPVMLTLREFQILFKLLSYPKRTFTRSQLLDEFSGIESESGLRSVDVHITNLRAKLSDCAGFQIVTVRGLGYKAVIG